MIIEIPDPEAILGMIIAFFMGLFALYLVFKASSSLKKPSKGDPTQLERLEYYEKQLIDMKIRLDSYEFSNIKEESVKNIEIIKENEQKEERIVDEVISKPLQAQRVPNMEYSDAIDFVLGLITNKSLTSRDIQIALGRSREHTSRLMKKLFQEEYVKRNTSTKPYTYSIAEKGKVKIGLLQTTVQV